VGVQVYGQADLLFHRSDKLMGIFGCDESGHILDAYGVAPQLSELDCKLGKELIAVNRADGIAYPSLNMLFHLLGGFDRALHIANVIHSIEYPEDIHAIDGRFFNELIHHIIGIMPVSHQILPAKQHLHGSVRHGLL